MFPMLHLFKHISITSSGTLFALPPSHHKIYGERNIPNSKTVDTKTMQVYGQSLIDLIRVSDIFILIDRVQLFRYITTKADRGHRT
jgi:hypothetical protein